MKQSPPLPHPKRTSMHCDLICVTTRTGVWQVGMIIREEALTARMFCESTIMQSDHPMHTTTSTIPRTQQYNRPAFKMKQAAPRQHI
jgi:hypothetical protein